MSDTVEGLPSAVLDYDQVQEQAKEHVDLTLSVRAATFDRPRVSALLVPKRSRWAQTEGTPLPLGATWIENEQAFNFAVYAEHADQVTLLLYSATDFENAV